MLLTVVLEPVAVLVCCGRVGLHRADPSVGVMWCRHPPGAMRSLLECLSYLFLQQLRGVAVGCLLVSGILRIAADGADAMPAEQ